MSESVPVSVLSAMPDAIAAFAAGRQVIIVDDEDRENEGDLVVAADFASAASINFMTVHGRGLVCVAMQAELIDRLQIPMMVPTLQNRSGFGTGFTVSVEAVAGVTTGISASDRAATIRTLIAPESTPADIATPGHMFPLRARAGGVLERRGQTEASVDMAKLAGLTPAAVICEVMREDGEMMRLPELVPFAARHDVPIVSVEQIAAWRREHEPPGAPQTPPELPPITRIGSSHLPTRHATFEITVFRDAQGLEHSALHLGDTGGEPLLVRVHSECLTGDAFGSRRCDCGEQLQHAMARVAEAGRGAVLYLRQEGRGIGLGNKIRSYALQDDGADTVDANEALGFPADARRYDVAAAMLDALGVGSIRLMTNNPVKQQALESLGIHVSERLPHVIGADADNSDYLATKARRMGHDFNRDA